jgi:outer membrane protein OmpA-like peptidoglycan-associated protein
MKLVWPMKARVSVVVLILAALVAACAADSPEIRPVAGTPKQTVDGLERSIADARAQGLDQLAPFWLSKAQDSLAAARRAQAQQAGAAQIARHVAVGQSQLERAESAAAAARTSISDVITQREMALEAGADGLEGFRKADREFSRLTKEIENQNLEYVLENKERVKAAFRDLEVAAVTNRALKDVRRILKEAEAAGAKKYAPKAYADAVRQTNAAEALIADNLYDFEEIDHQAATALFYARRAIELARQSKMIRQMDSEQLASWIEDILHQTARQLNAPDMRDRPFDTQRQNITGSIAALQKNQEFLITTIKAQESDIETLKGRVFTLEGQSRQEQFAIKQLEAQQNFNETFQDIQNSFSSNEAEVYRQGNQLVIRLRGMGFAVGKTAIMPENHRLLGKVQRAIRSFDLPEVIVEGHTDSTGPEDVNLRLSRGRAEAVKTHLVSNDTLPPGNVRAVGYGSSRPMMSNETPQGRAANRRIDIVITPRRSW